MTIKESREEKEARDYINSFTDGLLKELDSTFEDSICNILTFIDEEVDLGIEFTRQQRLILKLVYGLPLEDEDIAILEYWKALGKTTWAGDIEKKLQVLILEAGRRCLSKDTYIFTNQGLVKMSELDGINLSVDSLYNTNPVSDIWNNGIAKVTKVKTELGLSVDATLTHSLATSSGWKQVKDLTTEDALVIKAEKDCWPTKKVDLTNHLIKANNQNFKVRRTRDNPTAAEATLPTEVTDDLAYLLGALLIKGTWRDIRVRIHCVEQVAPTLREKLISLTGLSNVKTNSLRGGFLTVSLSGARTRFFFNSLGIKEDATDQDRDVPECIRKSSKEHVICFLRGLYDSIGGPRKAAVTSVSRDIIFVTHQLMLSLGIGVRFIEREDLAKPVYKIQFLSELDIALFEQIVGTEINGVLKFQDHKLTPRKLIKSRITKITELKEEVLTYDLTVPGVHNYTANSIVSHNSGKSTLASTIGAYEFYRLCKLSNPQKTYGISTSTPISILVLASTADQASKTIYSNIIGVMQNCAYFKRLEANGKLLMGKEQVSHDEKRLYIYAGNSKASSQVGGTVKVLIMDEAACFTDKDGESNAMLLWSDLGASCTTFGEDSLRIAISSAMYEGDAIEELYGSTAKIPGALGVKTKSWDLNPKHADRMSPVINEAYIRDPERAALLFEGIRPSAIHAMMDKEKVEASFIHDSCISVNVTKTNLINIQVTTIDSAPDNLISVLHLDPAVNKDSYALAFGHIDLDDNDDVLIYIDGIIAWEPDYKIPVNFVNVGEVIESIHTKRSLKLVTADHYNSQETIQRLNSKRIKAETVFFSRRQQLLMYDFVRQLFNTSRIFLPADSPWTELLKREFCQVQLLKGQKVDHPTNGSKDIADAVVTVAWNLAERYKEEIRKRGPETVFQKIKPLKSLAFTEQFNAREVCRTKYFNEILKNSSNRRRNW